MVVKDTPKEANSAIEDFLRAAAIGFRFTQM